MPRPPKIGIDYYPTDVGIVGNIKVQKLLRYHRGPAALGVLIALFSQIYNHGYYLDWDDDQRFVLSKNLFAEEEYIQEIIDACLGMGTFDQELFAVHKILTSRGIQQRYFLATNRRKQEIHNLPYIYPSIMKEVSKQFAKGEFLHAKTDLMYAGTKLMYAETELMHTESTQSKVKERKGKKLTSFAESRARENSAGGWSGDDLEVFDDVDGEVNKMKTAEHWRELVLKRYKFLNRNDQLLEEYIDRWAQEVKISGKRHQCLGDAKKHFGNWMNIQEDKSSNNRNYGTNSNNGYRSREDMLNGTGQVMSELIEEGRQPKKPLPVV